MKNLIGLIPIVMLITACSSKIIFSPEDLPVAYLNQSYQQSIHITGGTVIERSFRSESSSPSLIVTHTLTENGDRDYNHLVIEGTPQTLKPIYITISGSTYGTNFPGTDFEKSYVVEVRKIP